MKQNNTREISMEQLGTAFGCLLRCTSIRSIERMKEEMNIFLRNCGIDSIDQSDADAFNAGFKKSYQKHT